MDPLGILIGYASYFGLKSAKKPLRNAGVKITSELFNAVDKSKESAYNVKEGFEDIVAEAYYENMKKKQNINQKINQENPATQMTENMSQEIYNQENKEEKEESKERRT